MPVGGKGKPAGGYHAGKKGSYGCDGYPTVSADGTVHGCHQTKAKAAAQARAIWAATARKAMDSLEKGLVAPGDFVMFAGEEEIQVGRVEFVMTTPGWLGLEGSEYALEYVADDQPIIVRLYEEEDGVWEETEEVVYQRMSEVVKIESLTVSVDMVVEMGSNNTGLPQSSEEVLMGKSMYTISENVPACPGFAVVSNGNELDNCFSTRADAEQYIAAKEQEDGMETEKRERSTATRQRLAESGAAMPDGSFPIVTAQDLLNAIQSVGRAKDYEAARRHIMSRARALGMTDKLPESWTKTSKSLWGGKFDPRA